MPVDVVSMKMARRSTVFNWSRTQRCRPAVVATPTTEDQLRELVRDARARGQRVKVVGARHSWSDIAMSEDHGVLVSLDNMQALVAVDEARGVVRVQAGVRLHRLNELLDGHGLALPILGSVTEQSLAGVLSTGTHGSSLEHGNIPSFVVGLRLVTGTGEVLELHEADPRLDAARVGLGALGIITEVSIRVVPSFRLRETLTVLDFDAALAELPAIARSAEFVKVWWIPHTSTAMVFRCEQTTAPGRRSAVFHFIDTWILNKLVFTAMLWLEARLPRLTPTFNRLVARTYLDARDRIGRSDEILSLAMPPRHREMEYALPVERAGEALGAMRDLIAALGVHVNFIQELRFVKGDGGWLSPASARDSCQLGAYMAEAPGIEAYSSEFEARMRELGGRPHWGKEFGVGAEELRAMYPRYEDFVALAAELDPDGVFRNPFLDRVLDRLD